MVRVYVYVYDSSKLSVMLVYCITVVFMTICMYVCQQEILQINKSHV